MFFVFFLRLQGENEEIWSESELRLSRKKQIILKMRRLEITSHKMKVNTFAFVQARAAMCVQARMEDKKGKATG